MDGGARSAPSQKRPLPPEDGELVELLWQDGAVVAHYHREVGGNTGASGVTGEAASAWSREAGALGGDMYEQLWHDIAQLEGRVDGGTAASAWPPASSGAGSSRTGGEVGSSFCGSNLVAPALRVGDGAALPLPAGASTSGGTGSSAPLKRSRDELDGSRSEVAFSTLCWCQLVKLCFDSVGEEGRNLQGAAGFEAVDETRPASSKRRTRAAEVHNLSERRRRDRINEKMRALQELVPHCNKADKASILDEAIGYLKSLQLQVQIMWMTAGMAPMMLPGGHQQLMGMGLNSSCMPPTTQVLSQMQRAPPPFMNNPLPNQMPGVSSAATSVPNVVDEVHRNSIAGPRNLFFHPSGAPAATPEVSSLFGYGSQMAHQNAIQEFLAATAAPALGAEPPSSSDGTGTT